MKGTEAMSGSQKAPETVELTKEQVKEGYRVEYSGSNVLVWHNNNQIALLLSSSDTRQKVHDVVERNRKQLKEIEEKTGWKANS